MRKETILVIEDNTKNMRLFRILLKKGQYEILEATNAEEGIAMAGKRKPDLILMDIQLPGMDGLSATRLIRNIASLREIPVVGLSSYAMEEDARKALEAGCDGYIVKPINTRTFLDTLKTYLKNGNRGEQR
jgi:CheY-like chemotaxis protein